MTEPASRSCGGCTACCFTHAVEYFDKPVAQVCSQCTVGVGCKMYGKHPDECRDFECLWLLEEFPDEMRPDKFGVVVDFVSQEFAGSTFALLRLWEVRARALESVGATLLLQGLLETKCFIILKHLQPDSTYKDTYMVSPSLEAEYPDILKPGPR